MLDTTEGAMLEDVSTNGTWINDGEKMRKNDRQELKDGDSVKLYNSDTCVSPAACFTFNICGKIGVETAEVRASTATGSIRETHFVPRSKMGGPNTPAKSSADAVAQIATQPGSASSEGRGRAEAVPSPAAGAGVSFSSKHLADVLCAAFSTMQAMKGCLQTVQSKSEAFKTVQMSSKADGQYSKEQIAASISKCTPDSVTNAQELLSWLKVSAIEYYCE